jgi:hypothetical protein
MAHKDNNEKFKERLVNLYKGGISGKGTLPNSENLETKDIRCGGCLSDDPFIYCRQCEIKDCTQERGIDGCHQCHEFPCSHIDNFAMSVGKKVILRCVPYRRDVGTLKWMQDEEARYYCPECGNKVFRGAVKCNRCKTGLDLD